MTLRSAMVVDGIPASYGAGAGRLWAEDDGLPARQPSGILPDGFRSNKQSPGWKPEIREQT